MPAPATYSPFRICANEDYSPIISPAAEAPLIYFAQNGTYLDGFNGNASLPFQAGKTYRLRIVNTGAFSMFYFWIDGHQMSIIEVDGTDTEPLPVDMVS